MSCLVKVWSKDDLYSDGYLRYNVRTERDSETGDYFETYDPFYDTYSSILDRHAIINEAIKMLEAERDLLCKYGDSLLGATSFKDLKDSGLYL